MAAREVLRRRGRLLIVSPLGAHLLRVREPPIGGNLVTARMRWLSRHQDPMRPGCVTYSQTTLMIAPAMAGRSDGRLALALRLGVGPIRVGRRSIT